MKTALIVGASRGLGRALVETHLERGWTVIATVRDANALAGLETGDGTLEIETLDTTDWAGVDALAAKLDGRSIDLLFINAAIMGPGHTPIGEVEADAFSAILLVNTLAPLRIADRLAAHVPADGTIAVMSSSLGSIAQNESGGYEAYRISKAALDMGLRSIAARRKDEGRTYIAADPGWVRTDMGGPDANLAIDESIPRLADMLAARGGSGGSVFVSYDDRELPW